ncbi:MAG: orotidine-5'-phosphate decarboxylase [Casimicrobiaceae bacterium]|nr:orotidine-5'-phosphate decarboxylase [Casimicrobiaceae bacterium]
MSAFIDKLRAQWQRTGSLVCVGLDPELGRLPPVLPARGGAIFAFLRAIVDATHDRVCAYKPQFAHFAAVAAEDQLSAIIGYIREQYPHIPVILDAKRGDIGSTAEFYAREAFERYGADAVTVNPYLGGDAIEPFTRHADRGVFLLCRTTNPGGADLQEQRIDGEPLYRLVARKARHEWNRHGNLGLVVGATVPEAVAEVRQIVGEMPLLVPGVGAQGGDLAATVTAGRDASGAGLIVNVARAVLYASSGADFAQAARQVVEALMAQGARVERP